VKFVSGVALFIVLSALPARAQDDITTQNASSAVNGAYITGPASNPLSFLNGPAYRTFGSTAPYDFRDFHPVSSLNSSLPKWIAFQGEERLRFEAFRNGNFIAGKDDAYFLNRFRFQMDLRPAEWIKVVSQVQDARPIGQKPPIGPPNENKWDLKLAYAEAGNPEKEWISVRVGRQLINYNNTIIANSEWRDQGRSYDAIVSNLHYRRVRLGAFAASAVITSDSGVSGHQTGNNIFGLYGHIDDVAPNVTIEPFVLKRTQLNTKPGRQNEHAYGLRLKGNYAARLDYSIEAVAERGSIGRESIKAWATTFGTAYRFDSMAWRPRVFWQYDYASGDAQPADSVYRTFDTMYPTAHDRFGITDQFGWQNISAARGGITLEPHQRWTVSAQYLNFSLAAAADGLYNTSGGLIVRDITGKSGTHVGEEFDFYSWYELNRHFNVGAGVGRILPGSFLTRTTTGPAFTYPYFAINFKDNGKSAAAR
jgi:hypothetical protein